MAAVELTRAYPGITFRPRAFNWWARLTRVPPECIHLAEPQPWMAILVPDTLYLRGKAANRKNPARPEVSLCRSCLLKLLENELSHYEGRVLAFEPVAAEFSQYFFVATPDFDASGLKPEVSATLRLRLDGLSGRCQHGPCSRDARWCWFTQTDVASLDDVERIQAAPGQGLCPVHGSAALAASFATIEDANLFYVNFPYGESGSYVWI